MAYTDGCIATSAGSSTTITCTTSGSVASGSAVWVWGEAAASGITIAVTDSNGSSFTNVTASPIASMSYSQFAYSCNSGSGTDTFTVTYSSASVFRNVVAGVATGNATSGCVTTQAATDTTGLSSAPLSPSISAPANGLVGAVASDIAGVTWTAGAGYTVEHSNAAVALEKAAPTSATNYTPGFSMSAPTDWTIVGYVISPPSSGSRRRAMVLQTSGTLTPVPVVLGSINGHTAYGDPNSSNKLVSWLNPAGATSFSQFLHSAVNLVNSWPTVPSGNNFYTACSGAACPYFYANYGLNTAANSYQMQPADTASECVQSGIAWKTYSGSSTLLTTCEAWFAYVQANGVSTGTDYPGIPYAASTPNNSGATYDGSEPTITPSNTCPTGCNRIEPDKAANFALACLKDNEASGALTGCVTLAKKVADMLHSVINGSPSSSVSPYPFRIDASSGSVIDQYNSDVVSEARLQDDLLKNSTAYGLSSQQITNYTADRAAALTWLKGSNGPITTGNWCENYYEDQAQDTCASNYINTPALDTADYEIDNPSTFPNWATDVPSIITAVFTTAGLGSTDATGGNYVMAEQTGPYDCITVDATAHLALTYVKYGVADSNSADVDIGYRSFNWITYWLQATGGASSGQVVIGPTGAGVCSGQNTVVFFRVGYTDIIPEMLQAIVLEPSWGAS